jgi:hypothetical protein
LNGAEVAKTDDVPTAAFPRPSWLLVVNSVVVIAVCTLLLSVGLSAFASVWDPCAVVSGSIFVLLSVVLGLLQHRGTFRRDAEAARRLGTLFYVAGGFLLFVGALNVAEELGKATGFRSLVEALAPLFLLGIYSVGCGKLNRAWSRTLGDAVGAPCRPNKVTAGELAALAAVAAVATALTVCFVERTHPQFAEGVSPENAPVDLPEAASNVAYCQGLQGTIACEFTIDEAGFLRWVEAAGPGEKDPLERRDGSASVEILRCYGLSARMPGPKHAKIERGYYGHRLQNGREVYYGYDLDTGRAYFHRR